jgi:predicted SnoaL-like aldol condensation-catalyzing enzyme
MKKLCMGALVALSVFTACKQEAGQENSPAQKNLAAARTVADAFRTGNVSKLDSVVADDFTDHTPYGDRVGRDSLKAQIQMYRSQMKDMKMDVISETSDSNYVFQFFHFSGIPGAPDSRMIELTRFRDGKAIEHWTYGDWVEAMRMMMAAQQPAGSQPANPPETKK